jgi:flagellin-specific chaperone FliS
MCGYHGHYTDQAMIHFDNNHLHTESKEKKLIVFYNKIIIQLVYSDNHITSDDHYETSPVDESTNDNNHQTNLNETNDEEFVYYNPKDKRI